MGFNDQFSTPHVDCSCPSQRSSCWRLRFWHHFFLQESTKAQLPSIDQDLDAFVDRSPTKRAPLGMETLELWRLRAAEN